jgi:hypothetical protein
LAKFHLIARICAMMIECPCPGCGHKLKIPAAHVGHSVNCKFCAHHFEVPEPGLALESDVTIPSPSNSENNYLDDDDYLPIRRRKKKSNLKLIIFFGGLAVLAIVAVVLAIAKTQRVEQAEKERAVAKIRSADKPEKERVNQVPRMGKAPETETIDRRSNDPAEQTGQAAFGLSLLACFGFALLAYVVATVLLAIWVIRDSRNRSVENGVLWMLLIFPFNGLALIIYLASRPHGSLIPCENCGSKRLTFVGVCPHCRLPVKARGRVA